MIKLLKYCVIIFITIFPSLVHAQWVIKSSGTSNGLKSIYFVNESKGFAVGMFGTVLRTTDGGDSWTNIYIADEYLYQIIFTDQLHGWIGGNRIILATTVGGQTWSQIYLGSSYPEYTEKIVSLNSTEGWLAGPSSILADYLFMHTTDGGLSWEYVPQPYFTIKARNELIKIDN